MQFRSSFFSGSYAEAREKFLASAEALGGIIETHTNVAAGDLKGYPLATDIGYFGPKKPRCLILISSGSHGVEGFCGSGIQVGLLENNVVDLFPDGMGIFLIHALNPYGFAHCRRVNEDNVDLNRNFLDFSTATAPDDDRSITRDEIYPSSWMALRSWKLNGKFTASLTLMGFYRCKKPFLPDSVTTRRILSSPEQNQPGRAVFGKISSLGF